MSSIFVFYVYIQQKNQCIRGSLLFQFSIIIIVSIITVFAGVLCISRAQTMHLERQSLKSIILFILLLLLHSFSHSRISSRPHIIQNRADRTASV